MAHYFLILLFCTAAWFIVMDESVARAVTYIYDIASIRLQKWKWWILNNPRNPIIKYMIYRRSERMAKEILDSLKNETQKE